jgi:phosphate transport system protein
MARDSFARQMERLEADVAAMAEHARGMLLDGLRSLEAADPDLAEGVAARAQRLADLDESIEGAALGILTLQAPVASDLRRIGAILKLITYLNRIGRYGYDMAKVTKEVGPAGLRPMRVVTLRPMGRNVGQMLDLVLAAFRERRAADEAALLALEEEVDAQRRSAFREAVSHMLEDPRHIEAGAHLAMVARYLERCGDNVMKMAEKLHYAATGQRIVLN